MGEYIKYKRRVFGARPPIVSIRKPLVNGGRKLLVNGA